MSNLFQRTGAGGRGAWCDKSELVGGRLGKTDPIADMLTRIRNGTRAGHRKVDVPSSKMKQEIARILKDRGLVHNFAYVDDDKQGYLRIYLKYNMEEECAIQGLKRESRPGLRKYVGKGKIPRVLNGLGVAVVSTSRGVMGGEEAKRAGVGGEFICSVW